MIIKLTLTLPPSTMDDSFYSLWQKKIRY